MGHPLGGTGITLAGCDRNRIEKNSVEGTYWGIAVGGSGSTGGPGRDTSSDNTIAKNSSSGNVQYGILILQNTFRTLISGNNIDRNGFAGIHVPHNTFETVIDGNRADGNGDDGIHVDDSDSSLTDNTGNANGDLGIEAVLGVTDGGRNKARGNGNPLQCTGVACK
jgi:parallel beta-helix repeat protein